MAFSQIVNAVSLIAEQYQNLAAFAAVVGRVGSLDEAITASEEPSRGPLQVVEADAPVAYQDVTLRGPRDDRVLVQNLSLEVPRGRRVLITGTNGAGQRALFRATAGLWDRGKGRILHPDRKRVLFLPEKPYLLPGSLRVLLRTAAPPGNVTDERIWSVLRAVGLEALVQQLGGLDVKHDWTAILALGEQQQLAFARLLLVEPDFAFLDHAASALRERQQTALYQLLAGTAITYVSVGEEPPQLREHYDTHLELESDGTLAAGPKQTECAATA
jgi:putative ATP-binding cassette transporter